MNSTLLLLKYICSDVIIVTVLLRGVGKVKAEIIDVNGCAAIRINGEDHRFVGYRSWRPNPEYISAFDKLGFNFMTLLPSGIKNSHGTAYSPYGEYWIGDGKYDFDILRHQINDFADNAPNTYLAINIMLDTRDWFLREHPECPNSFIHLSSAIAYKPWLECAERMLRDTVAFLEREYSDKVFAIFLSAGGTCEWHNKSLAFPRTKETFEHYRAWCGDPSAFIPSEEELDRLSNGNLRDPKREANTVRFLEYFNYIITDTLAYFAGVVKEQSDGRLLVGAAAGYILVGEYPLSAHSGVADVMKIRDVDIIACPASYFHRKLDGVSASQAALDSIRLNKKFLVHSIDNTTYAANANPYAQILQYAHCRHSSMEESINYARRETAFAISKGAGFWFFDMYGGWYPDDESRAELAKIKDAYELIYSKPVKYNSEVAFIADPRSYIYTDKGDMIKQENVLQMIDTLGRISTSVDYLSVNDLLLDDFDKNQYKLYIVANSLAPTAKTRQAIQSLKENGASFIFLGPSGIISEDKIDISLSESFIGIKIDFDSGKEYFTLAEAEYTTDGEPKIYGGTRGGAFSPLLKANDELAEIMGRDFLSGSPRLAIKMRGKAFDAWSFRGALPLSLLLTLVKRAGVFVYQESGLPTYANSRMAAFFDHKGGERTLRFRYSGKIREVYSGEEYYTDGEAVKVTFLPNECKLFIYE